MNVHGPAGLRHYASLRAAGCRTVAVLSSTSSSHAPQRKHAAPRKVPALAMSAESSSSVDGRTKAAIAEAMKKIEPTMLTQTSRHGTSAQRHRRPSGAPISSIANQLATRKQIEPKKSGDQTRRFSWWAVSPVHSAANVVTL